MNKPNMGLDNLKKEFLSIALTNRHEQHWRQGQILLRIESILKNRWKQWVIDNLPIGTGRAKLLMRIGALSTLPVLKRSMGIYKLAEFADWVKDAGCSPDEAAARWATYQRDKRKEEKLEEPTVMTPPPAA